MTLSDTQNYSAIDLMRVAGFMFLIVAALNVTLQVIAEVLELFYLLIVATILLSIAIVILGIATRKLALISPGVSRRADVAGGWLIGYITFNILAAVFVLLSESIFGILALVAAFTAILARIMGFHQLNGVYKSLSNPEYSLNSIIFPLYGWYGVLSGVALAISEYTHNPTTILIVSLISIIGDILLLFSISYKLIRNSFALKKYKIEPIKAQIQTTDDLRSKVKEFASVENKQKKKEPKFCKICGVQIEHKGNYCEKCASKL